MGKKNGLVKLITKIHDPLDLDNKVLDKLGLPSVTGKNNGLFPGDPETTGSTAVASPGATPAAVSSDTEAAREAQRRRQLAAAGLSGNVLTGSAGLGSASTTGAKSLLGS